MTTDRPSDRRKKGHHKVLVPFSRPTIPLRSISAFLHSARDILSSGRLTLGRYTSRFENSISRFVGARYAVAMNSCTSVLFSIAMAIGLKPVDEVLVPAVTFASTANAAILLGSKPVLVDSDPLTFNMSIEDATRKLKRGKTKAIMVVHLGGNPVDVRPFLEICRDNNTTLIEDAAHALGSYYGGSHVGKAGRAGAFSFYPNKIITTGEGGCAITQDQGIASRLELIRCVGRKGLGPSDVQTFGGNFRMSELQAALGVVQMRTIRSSLSTRGRIAKFYDRELSGMENLVISQRITRNSISSRYAYIVVLGEGIDRDAVRKKLLNQYGVETSILYVPLHRHPYYRQLGIGGDLPVADYIGLRSLALPIYGHMTTREASYVISSLKSVLLE